MDPTKPVFLTKAQRERLAAVFVDQRRRDTLDLHHSLPLHVPPAPAPPASCPGDPAPRRTSDRDRSRGLDRGRCRSHGHDGDRGRKRGRRDHDAYRRREQVRQEEETAAAREREKMLDAIKEQYLGTSNKPMKRAIAKPSEKSRFCFDWEASDDTSCHDDSIIGRRSLLFGRGFLAGIDRREQKRSTVTAAASHEVQRHRENLVDVIEEDDDMPVDRHWSEKAQEEMTERDWRIFREDFSISYKGSRVPHPMRSWSESGFGDDLLRAIEAAGYRKPSPVQMAAIPLGLQQRDVIGVAETGSGKTAAFVLPMLSYIAQLPPFTEAKTRDGPYALVMVPTRELAQQIVDETEKFARYVGIRVMSIVGGKKIEEQRVQIEKGCEIVVATPGRLLDCLESRYVVLNQCNYVVLDEADRMTDMGFEPQVAGVLDAIPSSNLKPRNEDEELDERRIYRTTYMFSATMPPAVERLARKYLRNPVVVTIGTPGKVADRIAQNVVMVKESEKMQRLQKILRDVGDKTAIVFCNTKNTADNRTIDLQKAGFRATALHGDMSQNERDTSLDGFRNRQFNILVATEVAARGIDVPDVAHVINYDMPSAISSYTHRIGRTGRAGKKGVATSFLTLENTNIFFDLKQMLIESNSPVPLELAKHEASKFKPGSIKG